MGLNLPCERSNTRNKPFISPPVDRVPERNTLQRQQLERTARILPKHSISAPETSRHYQRASSKLWSATLRGMEAFSPQTLTEQQEKKERTPPPRVGRAKVLSVSTAGRPHLGGYGRKNRSGERREIEGAATLRKGSGAGGAGENQVRAYEPREGHKTRSEAERQGSVRNRSGALRSVSGFPHLSLASFCFVTARRARFL